MGRLMAVVVTSALPAWFPLSYQAPITEPNSEFESADVVSATDTPYPIQSIAICTVVLDVTVSETGTVKDVQAAAREVQSLREKALSKTKPLNGKFKRYGPGDQLLGFLNDLWKHKTMSSGWGGPPEF